VTWVAWRVQRPQLLAALGLVAVLALWLTATGLGTGHNQAWKYWTDGDVIALYALPALLGLALGAPLVASETSLGTQRLAWTQSISRTRWLAAKLLLGGLTAAALTAGLALLLAWWTKAVSLAASTNSGGFSGVRIQPAAFDVTGIAGIGYTLFAFALGAALGSVIRRPGWAFALGVPVFAVTRLVVQDWWRPHLMTPASYANLSGIPPQGVWNGWLLNAGLVPAGRTSPAPGQTWQSGPPAGYYTCMGQAKSSAAQTRCATLAHVHYAFQFQPASHYWGLQAAETAIFAGLAVLLLGVTVLAVRRWSS
jgi:hypothetical protein